MHPIKARNGSVFEPTKLHQSVLRSVKVRKREKLELERFGARGGGYGLRAASKISGNEGKNQRETQKEKSPIKREFLIFGWIDQVRIKNDRLWGESNCLSVRRSDGNRSRGVRRNRIKQNKPTLRKSPNSRFFPSTHLDQIMRLEPYWPARA
ncbi:hypothetical protein F2Q70_00030157 [Brassica cretica]|uniref:Uncharacterized protein n=1 Tax=Brassica cretica TaxID=69181 RepID=A0A8S9FML8_BRACR|nr:hypothetical protein F2Q70_00030157 [Brassica cretica]